MRLIDLTEKLNKVEFLNPDQANAFSDQDHRMITRPGYQARLAAAFDKTPFRFNIYFANLAQDEWEWTKNQNTNTGVFDTTYIRKHISSEYQPDPSAISLILTNNYADGSHPMTPWIVAHRFAHAVEGSNKSDGNTRRFFLVINNLRDEMYQAYVDAGYWMYNKNEIWSEIVALMTTKSSNSTDINVRIRMSEGEAPIELLTQFIVTGSIQFNTDHLVNDEKNLYRGDDDLRRRYIQIAEKYLKVLNREAANSLSRAVGKNFVI